MDFIREQSSGYMANWAARLFARAIDTKLKPLGLSSAYMPVLFALAKGATLSQKALAAAAAIEQPTMAATLSRMERDGLIEKQGDPADRRSSLYRLSPKGTELSADVRAAGRAINETALAGFTNEERDQFMAALSKVVGNLEAFLETSR